MRGNSSETIGKKCWCTFEALKRQSNAFQQRIQNQESESCHSDEAMFDAATKDQRKMQEKKQPIFLR